LSRKKVNKRSNPGRFSANGDFYITLIIIIIIETNEKHYSMINIIACDFSVECIHGLFMNHGFGKPICLHFLVLKS